MAEYAVPDCLVLKFEEKDVDTNNIDTKSIKDRFLIPTPSKLHSTRQIMNMLVFS